MNALPDKQKQRKHYDVQKIERTLTVYYHFLQIFENVLKF